MTPLISIVLCTYNNADSLGLTLSELAEQVVSPTLIEVIVVDNNSSDHTCTVVEQFLQHPRFRFQYIFEGRQGLSHARNSGINAATGEYILFTDDDAKIPNTWVAGYDEIIHEFSPDCLYSKIEIIWDKPQPWWYSEKFKPYFVGLDRGEDVLIITDRHMEFYGKNFCIKKSLILSMGGFDPSLGRNGTTLAAGEETLLFRNLVEQEKSIVYFPDSPVGHRLKDREYSEENIRKQLMESAHSMYYMAKKTAKKTFFGRPLYFLQGNIIELNKSLIGFFCAAIKTNKQDVFFYKTNISRSLLILRLWFSS